jgi:predicted ATPase
MSFEAAKVFGDDIQKIYKDYGYKLIEVPRASPEIRARFIKEKI